MKSNISKKPVINPAAADAFINRAPDAAPTAQAQSTPAATPAPASKPAAIEAPAGRKQAISLTIDPNLLARLDNVAGKRGISRAAFFSLAVSELVAKYEKEA